MDVDIRIHNAAKISAALSKFLSAYIETMNNKNTVICFISFDETPSVHIDDLTFAAAVAAKHVEPTDALPKAVTYFISP